MSYLASLALLCAWLVALTLAGRAFANLLPFRQRAHAKLYLAPALGLAFYLLLATASGWLVGERAPIAAGVTEAVSLSVLLLSRDRYAMAKQIFVVCLAGSLISFGPLASVLRFSDYNPYNDAFTYLVHGQWLQSHSFRETAVASWHPVYTQVLLYQTLHIRMGASFFLGWVQAASFASWSVTVYPVVTSVCLTSGALAIGGLVAAAVPRARGAALLWAVAAGTVAGGWGNGAVTGFLPQTCGVALVATLLALLAHYRPPTGNLVSSIRSHAPFSATLAALGFAYPEILPFTGLTVVVWFVATPLLWERGRIASWVKGAAVASLCSVALWNGEIVRIIESLRLQSHAVVGWPVAWKPFTFFCHAIGISNGGDATWSVAGGIGGPALALILGGGLLCSICFSCAKPPLARRTLPAAIFAMICVCGFAYFRFSGSNPWPVGKGQTWDQFKISEWVSPILLGLAGAGLALASCVKKARWAWPVLSIAFVANNLIQAYQSAPVQVSELARQTGRQYDSFSVYTDLRDQVNSLAGQDPVLINLNDPQEIKGRQMLAYFLQDAKVTADWSDDAYIGIWLPDGGAMLAPEECRWLIDGAISDRPAAPGVVRVGALEFRPAPRLITVRGETAGGHGLETDSSGWWSWVPHEFTVGIHIVSRVPVTIRLHFQYLLTDPPRVLTFTCRCGGKTIINAKVSQPGWQVWNSAPITLTSQHVDLRFVSQKPPVPIGTRDTRMAAFLIKNVRLDPVLTP